MTPTRSDLRPGPGWTHLGGSVYQHSSGTRVHMLGGLLLPGNLWFWGGRWPDLHNMDFFIRACGNKKRGIMAWGRWMEKQGVRSVDAVVPVLSTIRSPS
jgi:hypothetical protein